MALQKQTLSIPFVGGQDTKTDPKQVSIGKFIEIKNVTYRSTKRARKRNGYIRKASGTTLASMNTVQEYLRELVATDGYSVYSLNQAEDEMTLKGTKRAVSLSTEDVITNIYDQTGAQLAIGDGYTVLAWKDSSGGCRYSVQDETTGNQIVSNDLLSLTAVNLRVVRFGTRVLIFYWNGTNLVYRVIADATPTVLGAEVIITSGTSQFDALAVSTRCFIVYQAGDDVGMRYLDAALTLSAETLVTGVKILGASFAGFISLFEGPTNQVWATYTYEEIVGPVDFGVGYFIRDFNLGSVLAPTTIQLEDPTTGIFDAQYPVGVYDGTNGRIFYSCPSEEFRRLNVLEDPVPYDYYETRTATVTAAGSVTGPTTLVKSVGVASRTIMNDGEVYIMLTHDSELQPVYFLVNVSGSVVLKLAQGLGGGQLEYFSAPDLSINADGEYLYPYLKRRLLGSDQGDVYSERGVSVATIEYDGLLPRDSLGANLEIGGGIVSMYDGLTVAELGFNLYPEDILTQWSPAQGGLSDGSYQYAVTYEWTDNQGQVHRSAPSVPIQVETNQSDAVTLIATTTSASPTLTSLDMTSDNYTRVVKGMKVSGAGIPVGARIVDVTATTVLLDVNATASASNVTLTLTPSIQLDTVYLAGETSGVQVYQPRVLSLSGRVDRLDPSIVYLNNAGMILTGMDLVYQNVSYPVSAVVGNTVTLSTPLPIQDQNAGFSLLYASAASFTLGLDTVTGLDATFVSRLRVGQRVFSSSVTGNLIFVDSIDSATSITLTQVATATVVGTLNWGFDAEWVLREGMELDDADFTAGTRITQVLSVPNDPSNLTYHSFARIEIDQGATVSGSKLLSYESTSGVALRIPTLRVTDKDAKSPVVIVVYRTLVNGTVFYQVSSISDPIINDKSVDLIDYFDDSGDIEIQGNTQLYTTGGVLENIAPPAAYSMGVYKNRLFLIPAEDRTAVWFSQQVTEGVPVEFSDFLVIRLPETGGDAVSVAQMDDKVVFHKESSIFVTGGDGPSPNGLNNDYGYPTIVSSDVGCIDPRSLVLTPIGLMFKSAKGIRLIDRGLQIQDIGADVEGYNADTVTSATMVKNQEHVRLSLDSGVLLVYEYTLNQWITYTGLDANDACIWQDEYTLGISTGVLWQESPGTYTDDGALIAISGKTAWMSLADLQGFERIYKLLALGEYYSPHTLRFKVYKDFDAVTVIQNTPIAVSTAPTDKYQYRLFMTQQKCEALQFEFIEEQAGPSFGEGLSLSAFALEAGIKGGPNRMKAAASYG